MYFKKIIFAVLFLNAILFAQNNYSAYYYQSEFNLASPGAMRYGLYGSDNPAFLSTLTSPDLLFTWSDANGWKSIGRWGVYAAVPYLSFSLNREKYGGQSVIDYKLNLGFGNHSTGIGFSYGWSGGAESFFGRSDIFTVGTFLRNRYFSAGLTGNFIAEQNDEGIIELAVRPFGNELVSFFADYVLRDKVFKSVTENSYYGAGTAAPEIITSRWSVGAAFEVLPGIRITGRYFDKKYLRTGLEYSLGHIGFSTQAHFSSDKYLYNTYGIRVGSYDRNLIQSLQKDNEFVEMNLFGKVKYQRFRFLDNSNSLLELLGYIRSVKEDKAAAGVVINLSGMSINRNMIWEIRKELTSLKEAGKRVYIYFDRVNISGYYLASAADKIIMDPIGSLTLEGYLQGRTYLTGALEKIGIGYNELRFFKYKSAYETYSRKEMSLADEEQWQRFIDVIYEDTREGITLSRGFTNSYFDSLVNNTPYFLAEDASAAGLVDTIARWDRINEIVNRYEKGYKKIISPGMLSGYKNPHDNYWGEKPKIAVVYALGVCAMDEGINARSLVRKLESALTDPAIKAVVLRVDSPGGDGLASDLIAEKIKEFKYRKPVIVSQGNVAGSGGYWLSMYGDTIVAAPGTVTGSIGVIGAWVYNKDLKEKTGITTDYVKRGAHADLFFGMTVPFIGLTLPDRDLTEAEENKFRSSIESEYRHFVDKVAYGRKKTYDEVNEIGQGRVWTGIDALDNGLVDVIGNLNTAVDIAVRKAGLQGQKYEIIEIPEPKFIDLNIFVPKIFGINIIEEDPVIQNLRFRILNSGYPMPMIPLGNETAE